MSKEEGFCNIRVIVWVASYIKLWRNLVNASTNINKPIPFP